MNRFATSLALLLSLGSGARASYLTKGSQAAAGARNIVLIYNSSYDASGTDYHRNWQQADFIPILAYRNASGSLVTPMFDSVLVLGLRAQSGRGFTAGFGTGPSTSADWAWYLDSRLFGGDSHLRHLDNAASQVQFTFGAPDIRIKVFLMVPYPDSAQHDFGAVDGTGRSLDFAGIADRLAAVQWYVTRARELWAADRFRNLDLAGWYWLEEQVPAGDQALLPKVSSYVHTQGARLIWIPYYNAAGFSRWREWGFDAAIYQPNYFFSETVPINRLTDAANAARLYGMGVELEFDDRVIGSDAFRARYEDYLRIGRTEGYQNALTAWYMGADAMLKCALSTDPAVRAIYDDTYNFIARVPLPGDVDGTRTVTMRDALMALAVGGGLKRGTDYGVSVAGGDVVPNQALDVGDAAKILRSLNGLQPSLP